MDQCNAIMNHTSASDVDDDIVILNKMLNRSKSKYQLLQYQYGESKKEREKERKSKGSGIRNSNWKRLSVSWRLLFETTPLSWNQWETLTKKEWYLIDEEEVQQQNVECQSNYYFQHLLQSSTNPTSILESKKESDTTRENEGKWKKARQSEWGSVGCFINFNQEHWCFVTRSLKHLFINFIKYNNSPIKHYFLYMQNSFGPFI